MMAARMVTGLRTSMFNTMSGYLRPCLSMLFCTYFLQASQRFSSSSDYLCTYRNIENLLHLTGLCVLLRNAIVI